MGIGAINGSSGPTDVRGYSAAGTADPSRGGGKPEGGSGPTELTEEEKQQVAELKKRDAEVRAHEQAHMGAGGQHVRGGASYEYEQGPDGNKYAVGGEVSIDTSPVKGDPAATIRKMQQIRAAALAPANPSGQDRAVAAQAGQVAAQAAAELASKKNGSPDGASKGELDTSIDVGRPSSRSYTAKGLTQGASITAGAVVDTVA